MDIEKFIVIEKHISEAEDKQVDAQRDSLRARWEFGREMLAERVELGGRSQLPNGMLAELGKVTGAGRSELQYRMQFAEKYPTEEGVSMAMDTLGSWTQIKASLSQAGKGKRDMGARSAERPGGSRDPELLDAIREDRAAGRSTTHLKEDRGISGGVLAAAESYVIGEEAALASVAEPAPIDWSTLNGTVKAKEERMRKQIRRELEAEFEPVVQAEVQKRIGDSFKDAQRMQTDAKRVLEARKGIMTKAEFQLILACLHPDNSASTDKRDRAFDLFRRAEIVLLDEKQSPAVQSLPSMEELLKRRKR